MPAPACVPAVPDSTEDRRKDPRRNEAREQPQAGEGAARAPGDGGVAGGRVGEWWVAAWIVDTEEFEFVADAVSGVGRMVGEEAAVSVALEVSPRVGDLV